MPKNSLLLKLKLKIYKFKKVYTAALMSWVVEKENVCSADLQSFILLVFK